MEAGDRIHLVNMRLVFLGTSSAVPTAERGLSSIAIVRGSELLLFDAGEGMQRNFIKAGLGMNRKMKIFISHMHADHCAGLLGLLQTMALQGRDKAIDIYGEPSVKEFLIENRRIINFGLTYDLNLHVIEGEGVVLHEDDYEVRCCAGMHSIPSLAYVIHEYERPGRFNISAAKQLGVPEGELYGRLQRGEDIMVDGKKVYSEQVVGHSRSGRRIGISGDTRPTEKLAAFFERCDVLVFESTYSKDMSQKALENWHSTTEEAATIAKKAGVKKLFLTHFSARYDRTEELVAEARRIFENSEAAEDLKAIDIPYPEMS